MQHLPEFLWEPAIAYAAYIQNRAYTQVLTFTTLYEIMYGTQANVMHFCELGSPLWILNNGPNTLNKILPKAIQKIFAGFDDGAHAVQYYSKDTWRILTS